MVVPLESIQQDGEALPTPSHRSFRSASGARDGMTLRLVTDESQWTDLLTRAPAPHVTQSYAFGEGKRANGWRMARSAFVQRGKVIAICQIQERTVAGIRVASRVSRGPLSW